MNTNAQPLPISFPLPQLSEEISPISPNELTRALAGLGYPGFSHLAKTPVALTPAELMARALAHANLELRLVEALPWLLSKFHGLDRSCLTSLCRFLNLQNRLGFFVAVAREVAKPDAEAQLRAALASLELSRFAA